MEIDTKWLRKNEAKMYKEHCENCEFGNIARDEHLAETHVYESLAECRRLLKKHEWDGFEGPFCPECDGFEDDGHAPDCAIAAQLEGLPRKDGG